MNNRSSMKGMSQILSLVVGAAILMMVAMILMLSATDVIGGGVADAEMDSCANQVEVECTNRATISAPSACAGLSTSEVNSAISGFDEYPEVNTDEASVASGDEVQCEDPGG